MKHFPLEVIAVNDAPDITFVDEIGYADQDVFSPFTGRKMRTHSTLLITLWTLTMIYRSGLEFSFNKENLIPSVNQIMGPPTPKKLTRSSGGLINKAKNMVDDGETPDALEHKRYDKQ